MWSRKVAIALGLVAAAVAVLPAGAAATFPGRNGMLVALFNSSVGKSGTERGIFEGIQPSGAARRIYYCTEYVGNCGAAIENPSISADGRELAFDGIIETDSYVTQQEITLLRFGKFGLTLVPFTTTSEEEYDTAPAWIAGSDSFVFSVFSSYGGPSPRCDSETTAGKQITEIVKGTCDRPAVSPNGQGVLYDRGAGLWSTPIDGANPALVLAHASHPSWSPSGKLIAFVSGRAVYVSSPTGAGRRKLAADGSDPVWSPNGKLIAYAIVSGEGRTTRIYTRPAAGGAAKLLFTERLPESGSSFGGMDWQALGG